METKTSDEIYLTTLDVIEANKKSGYDDRTTKERLLYANTKWVSVDDITKATWQEIQQFKIDYLERIKREEVDKNG